MMEEQQRNIVEDVAFSLGTKVKVFGAGMVPMAIIDIASKGGGLGLVLGGAAAALLAWQSDRILADINLPPSLFHRPQVRLKADGTRTMADRLLGLHKEESDEEYWQYDSDDSMDSSMFTFSQLLASGFTPSLHKIFMGRLVDGTDVFVEAKELCHVALAGNTGNGKTSLLRLIMAQLCFVGVKVVLLNPHYMIYDYDHDEDWTPYTPYLERDPVYCSDVNVITSTLKFVVENTLVKRMKLSQSGKPAGKPYFVIIDELPAIVAKRKECAGYIAEILREGRKYGIYLIVASQDFLVKTTGMDTVGGAVRKCFRTACYVGGDPTTATVLLEKQATPIPETELGRGTMMLRCFATADKKAVLANVPYCDNEALYTLLGPSTFVGGDSDESEAEIDFEAEDEQDVLGNEQVLVPVVFSEKVLPVPSLNDAIEVWNEAPGMGSPKLQEMLTKRGFACSSDKARKFIKDIKEMIAQKESE